MDPANAVSGLLSGVIRLDLLQDNPAQWIGTIGCELFIEILLTITGVGAAAVAAKLSEKVLDLLRTLRRDFDTSRGLETRTPAQLRIRASQLLGPDDNVVVLGRQADTASFIDVDGLTVLDADDCRST